jgi:uncharacterized protein
MTGEELSVASGGVTLWGTLTLPEAPAPHGVVLMIQGSGPLDRDENMPGQKLDIFNALAEAFGQAGYASLRADKRGCGASQGDYFSHGYADLIADARAWADLLAARSDIGRLYLLGHSEGTAIAPLAAEGRDDIAGLILLCPYVTPGREILMAQADEMARALPTMPGFSGWLTRALSRLTGGPVRQQARLIVRLTASEAPVLRAGGAKIEARVLRDFLNTDTRALHGRCRLPVLALSGAKDLQCPPGDGAEIARLNPRAEAALVPDLTHILRRDPGAHSFLSYPGLLDKSLDPQVAALILNWLSRQGGKAGGSATST